MTRRRRRWLMAGAGALPVAFLALLFGEAQYAGNGTKLTEQDFDLARPFDSVAECADPTGPTAGSGAGGSEPGGASRTPMRIAVLGDSTAAGVGSSSRRTTLPGQIACGLGRPVRITGFAVSGARLDDVVAEQLPRLLALPPDSFPQVVLVSVGANDVTHLTRANAFRAAYLGLLGSLQGKAAVIVLGVPDLGSATRLPQPLRFVAGVRGGTYDAIVEAMRDQGADYVNIADFTGPRFREDPDRYFAADHYHPSDDGYGVWAQTVVPVVRWRIYKLEHPNDAEPLMPKEAKGTVKGDAP